MSFKAMAWAWDLDSANSSEKLVLLCLADCANAETGHCWPGRDHIARRTRLNRKTISTAIVSLERQGLISVQRTTGGSNTYRLHTDRTVPAPAPRPENGSQETRPENGPRPDPKTGHDLTQNRASNLEGTWKEPTDDRPGASAEHREAEKPPAEGPRKLPADWYPDDQTIKRIEQLGYTVADPHHLIAEFVDYWHHRGARKKQAGWARTLINRFKHVHERENAKGAQHGRSNGTDVMARDLQRVLSLPPGQGRF